MGMSVEFNLSELMANLDKLGHIADDWVKAAQIEMADTLMLLSREEVPHKDGILMGSANVEYDNAEKTSIVSYNTEYAAFQHEGMRPDGTHIVVNYSKPGRKKKFLEEPLKINESRWAEIFAEEIGRHLNGKL